MEDNVRGDGLSYALRKVFRLFGARRPIRNPDVMKYRA
jgi:hypothetical protein